MTTQVLISLCFAIWSALTPRGQVPAAVHDDAPIIADAIAEASIQAPIPTLGPRDTAGVLAYWTWQESRVRLHPVPWRGKDGKPVDGLAHGFLQIRGPGGLGTPIHQALAWLRLERDGERTCPAHPFAPLVTGMCSRWHMADRRLRAALGLAADFERVAEAR